MKASVLEKTEAAWTPVPSWLRVLCKACDRNGVRNTAKRLRVSAALLSRTFKGERGTTDFLKKKVEAVLSCEITPCPVYGVIPRAECLQAQERPFSTANPLEIQRYKMCRECRYNEGGTDAV